MSETIAVRKEPLPVLDHGFERVFHTEPRFLVVRSRYPTNPFHRRERAWAQAVRPSTCYGHPRRPHQEDL